MVVREFKIHVVDTNIICKKKQHILSTQKCEEEGVKHRNNIIFIFCLHFFFPDNANMPENLVSKY